MVPPILGTPHLLIGSPVNIALARGADVNTLCLGQRVLVAMNADELSGQTNVDPTPLPRDCQCRPMMNKPPPFKG